MIADEVAFWMAASRPRIRLKEVFAAVRPGLTTLPGSLLVANSSPHARRGPLWQAHRQHFGKDSRTLVWVAETRSYTDCYRRSVRPSSAGTVIIHDPARRTLTRLRSIATFSRSLAPHVPGMVFTDARFTRFNSRKTLVSPRFRWVAEATAPTLAVTVA